MYDDPQLLSFATQRELDYIEALRKYKTTRKAAPHVGVTHQRIAKAMQALRKRAQAKLYAPEAGMRHPVLEGFRAKGYSHFIDKDGKPSGYWIKAEADKEKREEALRAAAAAMAEDIPRLPPMPHVPTSANSDLCNCYVITDFHLGALSWKEETGASWDIEIAERTLLAWFAQAIAQSPNAETAVFAQISDFLHSDGIEPLTPASKHVLDVDTRFAKVVRVVIRILRQVIDMLLAKHKYVHILMADANHDPVSQIWLREWFAVLYENEPRITVDQSPSPYNVFEFGKTVLFFHHGHKRKVSNIAEVFAGKFREVFGRTKHAYAHMGHLHHLDIKENNLMIVEQHRTLTAPDAYSSRAGFQTGRDAQCITYHREFGEVSRVKVSFDMLRTAA